MTDKEATIRYCILRGIFDLDNPEYLDKPVKAVAGNLVNAITKRLTEECVSWMYEEHKVQRDKLLEVLRGIRENTQEASLFRICEDAICECEGSEVRDERKHD